MALFGSMISDDIKKILDERIILQSDMNSNTYVKWLSRTPWIRLFSNAIANDESKFPMKPSNLAEYYILEGAPNITKGDFDTTYNRQVPNTNEDIPFRAHPIISGCNIITKGKYGSLRQANINIKCYSRDQLYDLELLYMTPGITCVLQWGYSVNSKGETVTGGIKYDNIDIQNTPGSIDFLNYVNKIRRENDFAIDAIWGYVTNFNYSLTDNGTFDISIELTAAGFEAAYRAIESSVSSIDSEYAKKLDRTKDNLKTHMDRLRFKLNDLGWFTAMVPEADLRPIKINGDWYLPWGFIEKYILEEFVSNYNDNINNFSYGDNESHPFNTPSQAIGRFESTYIDKNGKICYMTIRYHDKLMSMDPTKIIIPGKPIPIPGYNYDFKAESFPKSGYLKRILINFELVYNAFKENELIFDAVKSILSEINKYSCDYWDLILIPDTYENKCKIIDSRWWTDDLSEPFEFNIYSSKSIVYSCDLQSTIPDSYKTAALYTLNATESDDNSIPIYGLFGNVKDRILSNIKSSKRITDLNTMRYDNEEYEKGKETFNNLMKKKNILSVVIPEESWKYQKELLKESGPDNSSIYENRIIPLSISLTIDGISGLEFGNMFKVDYVPQRYHNVGIRFQIVEVKDEINKKYWKTTFTGIMRFLGDNIAQNG